MASFLVPYFVDSVWNEWSQWGSCNASCGYGTEVRTKNSTKAVGEGNQLALSQIETRSCKIVDCPRKDLVILFYIVSNSYFCISISILDERKSIINERYIAHCLDIIHI